MVKPTKKLVERYYKELENYYNTMSDEELVDQIMKHTGEGKIERSKSETALHFLLNRWGY